MAVFKRMAWLAGISLPLIFLGCSEFGLSQSAKFKLLQTTNVLQNGIVDNGDRAISGETFDDWDGRWPFETLDNGFGSSRPFTNETLDGGGSAGGDNQNDGGANGNNNNNDGGSGGNANQNDGGSMMDRFGMPGMMGIIGGNGLNTPNNNNNDGGGGANNNGQNPNVNGNNNQNNDGSGNNNNNNDGDNPTMGQVPIVRLCSDKTVVGRDKIKEMEGDPTGQNVVDPSIIPLVEAESLWLVLTDMDDNIVCESMDTTDIKDQILNGGKLDLAELCGMEIPLPAKIYLITDQNKNVLDTNRNSAGRAPEVLEENCNTRGLEVLFADNPKRDIIDMGDVISDQEYDLCDDFASPLFVDMRGVDYRSVGFELSAPWQGVLFDILGANSDPAPYTPKQISWFDNAAMAFIVLPDHNGQVKGVDQLFGDNTKGPDGRFSDNGFTALAKFDGLPMADRIDRPLEQLYGIRYNQIIRQADGLIDANDDVYKHLRLWSDVDKDGVSDPGELISLAEAGVLTIDLNYDPNFKEEDKYGNEVKYKSAAGMSDGSLQLVFDVWFRVYNQ